MCWVVFVNLPILKLQSKRWDIGEHLIAHLNIVARNVGYHPECEHLGLIRCHPVSLALVQQDLRPTGVDSDGGLGVMVKEHHCVQLVRLSWPGEAGTLLQQTQTCGVSRLHCVAKGKLCHKFLRFKMFRYSYI